MKSQTKNIIFDISPAAILVAILMYSTSADAQPGPLTTRTASTTAPAALPAAAPAAVKPPVLELQLAALEKRADAGDAAAMGQVGDCYAKGRGVPQDWEKAAGWYRRGADLNDVPSIRELGICYTQQRGNVSPPPAPAAATRAAPPAARAGAGGRGRGGGRGTRGLPPAADPVLSAGTIAWQDRAIGLSLLTRAADAGDTPAMVALGDFFSLDIKTKLPGDSGSTHDFARARDYYSQAANAGDAGGMVGLASYYHLGIGNDGKPDQNKAMGMLAKASNQGSADAMLLLAHWFETGDGVEKNMGNAYQWYGKSIAPLTKAAEDGDAYSMLMLGNLAEHGKGMQKDPSAAFKWYQQGAAINDDDCSCALAACYLNGVGTAKDQEKAAALYTRLAANGNMVAMRCLGLCYHDGAGVNKDNDLAVIWLARADEAGDAISPRLSADFSTGLNNAQLSRLYERGADRGDVIAMYKYAVMISGTPDIALAYATQSANAGYEPAKKMIPDLKRAVDRARLNAAGYAILGAVGQAIVNAPPPPDTSAEDNYNQQIQMEWAINHQREIYGH